MAMASGVLEPNWIGACVAAGVLRHDLERQIIPIAAFVAGSEVIAVDGHNPAIGQVAKGAADGISARVTDQSQS